MRKCRTCSGIFFQSSEFKVQSSESRVQSPEFVTRSSPEIADILIQLFDARLEGEGIVHPEIVTHIEGVAVGILGHLQLVVLEAEEVHKLIHL